MKKLFSILTIFLLFILVGCTNNNEDTKDTDNIGKNEKIVEVEKDSNQLLDDPYFTRGFHVTAFDANESKGVPIGVIDYEGNAVDKEPVWRLAQWGDKYSLLDATVTKKGNYYEYQDQSKIVKVNPWTGEISLYQNAKAIYGDNDRKNGEAWPHLLLEQAQVHSDFLKNYRKLFMEVNFTLKKMENKMNGPVDNNLHAAQFQWFITLQNLNPNSSDYGRGMWFGLGFYDSRYDGSFVPGYAAQDGGKEDNTGMYIYIVDSRRYLDKPVQLNKEVIVKFDIIPHVKQALQIAQSNNFLKNTKFEDLKIGSTNIGWELPGTFDVGVDIHKLNIFYE